MRFPTFVYVLVGFLAGNNNQNHNNNKNNNNNINTLFSRQDDVNHTDN